MELKQLCDNLKDEAIKLGATACAILPSQKIQVKHSLAALCNADYVCPNYGLGAGCPPHVGGPDTFRQWQSQSRYSIIIKIELPTSIMFSSEGKNVMRLLHQIVATVERSAVKKGFENSKAFAGGSCKHLFCESRKSCCVMEESSPCPHTAKARPSMSGFGIDVSQLMLSCGWSGQKAKQAAASDHQDTSWIAGLILVA